MVHRTVQYTTSQCSVERFGEFQILYVWRRRRRIKSPSKDPWFHLWGLCVKTRAHTQHRTHGPQYSTVFFKSIIKYNGRGGEWGVNTQYSTVHRQVIFASKSWRCEGEEEGGEGEEKYQ